MSMSPDEMEKTLRFLLALLPEESLQEYDNMMLSGASPIAADSKPDTDAADPKWMRIGPFGRNALRALKDHKPGLPLNMIALDAAAKGKAGRPLLSTIPGFKSDAFPDFDKVMGIESGPPKLDENGKLI